MTYRTMNSAWKKLWLNCIASRNFESFDTEDFAFVDDIVSLDKNMSLEVNNEDVRELVEDLKNELSTELKQHQEQPRKAIEEEISSEKEIGMEDVPISLIHKYCTKWGEVQSFVE